MATLNNSFVLPNEKLMMNACKLAIVQDKRIMVDYWLESFADPPTACIGQRENGDRLLIKSGGAEYSSSILKLYKVDNELLVVTENSIYLVSSNIESKRIDN